MDGEENYSGRTVISKIMKLDENNQYGFTMAQPLQTGCFKHDQEIPSLNNFNLISENVNLQDKIGHIFVACIEFHERNQMGIH